MMNKSALTKEDWAWVREWTLKIGGSGYLLLTFAFLTSHSAPGSFDSLVFGASRALPPGLMGASVTALLLILWRRRG